VTLRILCVGKLKESYYAAACAEFGKRLSRYARVQVEEVADEKAPEKLSGAERQRILDAEGARLLAKIAPGDYVVAMDLAGGELDSPAMASFLQSRMNGGKSAFVFLIGGSLGLGEAVRARADFRLRFGKNTFSHQIFRLMLLEQLYRCMRILHNEPYHK